MAIPSVNITIEKGVNFENTFTINDSDGVPFNLTNYSAIAKIKKYPSSPISNSFSILINAPVGQIQLSMGSSITAQLSEGRNYYDIVIVSTGYGTKTKVIEGSAIVTPSISL
jgi:hypothetical protein